MPRVNRAPYTRSRTFAGVTPPWRNRCSAPASTATTASKTLGCGSVSSWIRIFGFMDGIAQPAKGCLTVSFCAVISVTVGRPFMARSMESLVAS